MSTCQNCQPHMLCKETQRGRDALWYHLPPVNSLILWDSLGSPNILSQDTGAVRRQGRQQISSAAYTVECVWQHRFHGFALAKSKAVIHSSCRFKVLWEAKSSNLVSTSRLIVDSRWERPLSVNWFTGKVLEFSFSRIFSLIFSQTLLWWTSHSVGKCKTRPTFKAALSHRNTQRSKLLRHPPEQRGFLIIRILKSHFWCSVIVPSTTLLRFVSVASMEAVSPSLPNS